MAAVPDRLARLRSVVWRPLVDADLAYVAALEAQIHAAPWSYGNFRDALAAGYSAQVGEREGRIVVFGVMMRAPGEAQILNLSVVPTPGARGSAARCSSASSTTRCAPARSRCSSRCASRTCRRSRSTNPRASSRSRAARTTIPPTPGAHGEDALVMRRRLRRPLAVTDPAR